MRMHTRRPGCDMHPMHGALAESAGRSGQAGCRKAPPGGIQGVCCSTSGRRRRQPRRSLFFRCVPRCASGAVEMHAFSLKIFSILSRLGT